jgi:hypothetical protein
MQFWRGVFERRAPQSIAAVEAVIGADLRQGNSTRNITSALLDALTRAHHEAVSENEHGG